METVDLEGAAARDRSTIRGKGEEVSLLLLLSIRYGCGGGWKEEGGEWPLPLPSLLPHRRRRRRCLEDESRRRRRRRRTDLSLLSLLLDGYGSFLAMAAATEGRGRMGGGGRRGSWGKREGQSGGPYFSAAPSSPALSASDFTHVHSGQTVHYIETFTAFLRTSSVLLKFVCRIFSARPGFPPPSFLRPSPSP